MSDKLTVERDERREFNRWFVRNMADADHRFDHMPRWLKADLWQAWQAGRTALKEASSHAD